MGRYLSGKVLVANWGRRGRRFNEVSAVPSDAAKPPGGAQTAPRSVLGTCVLWVLPVLGEIAALVYVGFMVAWAASIGGPAWDYPIFIGAPGALISIVLLAIQIPCAVRLPRGSRGARIALVVVGIVTAFLAVFLTRPTPGSSPPWVPFLGFAIAAAAAGAIVLTFTPTANRFFQKKRPTPAEAVQATVAETTASTLRRFSGWHLMPVDESTRTEGGRVRARRLTPMILLICVVVTGCSAVPLGATPSKTTPTVSSRPGSGGLTEDFVPRSDTADFGEWVTIDSNVTGEEVGRVTVHAPVDVTDAVAAASLPAPANGAFSACRISVELDRSKLVDPGGPIPLPEISLFPNPVTQMASPPMRPDGPVPGYPLVDEVSGADSASASEYYDPADIPPEIADRSECDVLLAPSGGGLDYMIVFGPE